MNKIFAVCFHQNFATTTSDVFIIDNNFKSMSQYHDHKFTPPVFLFRFGLYTFNFPACNVTKCRAEIPPPPQNNEQVYHIFIHITAPKCLQLGTLINWLDNYCKFNRSICPCCCSQSNNAN